MHGRLLPQADQVRTSTKERQRASDHQTCRTGRRPPPPISFHTGLRVKRKRPVVVIGFDVAVANEAGTLVSVLGFPDKVPA